MLRIESKLVVAMSIGAGIGAGLSSVLCDILVLAPGAWGAGIGAVLGAFLGLWVSPNFTVFDEGGTPIGWADLSKWLWRGTTKLETRGTPYEAHSKGRVGKEYVLETEDGRVVAVAERPSVWRNHFVLEYGSKRYELTKKSVRGGAYVLLGDGGSPIGSVRGKGFFKREWTVDLPEELPLEVEMFIMWLIMGVVIMGGVPMNSREGWTIGIGAAIGVVIGGGFGSIVFGVGLVGLLAGVAGGTIGMALGTSLADHRRR